MGKYDRALTCMQRKALTGEKSGNQESNSINMGSEERFKNRQCQKT